MKNQQFGRFVWWKTFCSDSSCERTKLDNQSSEWVGLKVSACDCVCVCVCVWWLGDTSGGRHAGPPCVWECVCVYVCVCVCVCVTCWGRERRGVTRSPNSCLGDWMAARGVQHTHTHTHTLTHTHAHTCTKGGREGNSTTNIRQTGKQMLQYLASPNTHTCAHRCNITHGDQLVSLIFPNLFYWEYNSTLPVVFQMQ